MYQLMYNNAAGEHRINQWSQEDVDSWKASGYRLQEGYFSEVGLYETEDELDEAIVEIMAIITLWLAWSRLMGQSPASYTEREDVAAGLLIKHQMSPEYRSEQESKKMIAEMLAGGMSPDDIKALWG